MTIYVKADADLPTVTEVDAVGVMGGTSDWLHLVEELQYRAEVRDFLAVSGEGFGELLAEQPYHRDG